MPVGTLRRRSSGGRSALRWAAARHVRTVALVATLVASHACRGDAPLHDSQPSLERLAEAVLEALASRDEATLERLALDEGEFRRLVWPELPASRPERNLPFDYVWGDLAQKSRGKLAETLANHGGRRFALVAVEFTGGSTPFRTFVVHRDSRLRVRDGSGEELALRLFGSVVQHGDGQFKVFSYNVDD